MSVNIWNRGLEWFTDHVNGTEVTIPPRGCVQVSERKADELVRRHAPRLSLAAPGQYTDDEIAALRGLRKEDLLAVAEKLMRGERVTVGERPAPPAETRLGPVAAVGGLDGQDGRLGVEARR